MCSFNLLLNWTSSRTLLISSASIRWSWWRQYICFSRMPKYVSLLVLLFLWYICIAKRWLVYNLKVVLVNWSHGLRTTRSTLQCKRSSMLAPLFGHSGEKLKPTQCLVLLPIRSSQVSRKDQKRTNLLEAMLLRLWIGKTFLNRYDYAFSKRF